MMGMLATSSSSHTEMEYNDAEIRDTESDSVKIRRSLCSLNNSWMDTLYRRRGLFYALLVSMAWCASDVCTKILARSLHPMEIAFLRQCALTLTVTPFVVYHNVIVKDTFSYWKLLVIRGICGAVNTLFRTLACNFMSIGNVSAVTNTVPIFAALLGWIVLRERIMVAEGLMSLVAITGVVLIAQPPFLFNISSPSGEDNFIGVIFALGEAFTTALSIVMLRKLGGKSVNISTPIFYFAVIGIFIDGILTTILKSWTLPPCLPERLLLVAFSPLVLSAQYFLAEASRLEKALNVSLVALTTICISLVLQWFIFKTLPNWISAAGTLMVLASAVTLIVFKSSKSTNKSRQDEEGGEEEAGGMEEFEDTNDTNENEEGDERRDGTYQDEL